MYDAEPTFTGMAGRRPMRTTRKGSGCAGGLAATPYPLRQRPGESAFPASQIALVKFALGAGGQDHNVTYVRNAGLAGQAIFPMGQHH